MFCRNYLQFNRQFWYFFFCSAVLLCRFNIPGPDRWDLSGASAANFRQRSILNMPSRAWSVGTHYTSQSLFRKRSGGTSTPGDFSRHVIREHFNGPGSVISRVSLWMWPLEWLIQFNYKIWRHDSGVNSYRQPRHWGPRAQNGKGGPKWPELRIKTVNPYRMFAGGPKKL